MRIAFCGHSHHRTTGSSGFVLELLRERGAVEVLWDDAWRNGAALDLAPVLGGGFDAVVVWQMEDVALRLAGAGLGNVTFFPMYDGCHARPDAFWRALAPLKVVCFSSTLHEHVQRLGVRSRFARYFPEPDPARRASGEPGLAGYFWQRQQDVTWATVRALLGDARFERFTLQGAVDPGYGVLVAPSAEDAARFSIRRTGWFPSRAEALTELARHNVYFAPRLREGIGMSFLEAMAMGFLVVAPDRPTMNEYIVSGVNGLLYDPANPRPLDLSARAALGARARQTIERGWEAWRRVRPALVEYVLAPAAECPVLAPLDALDPLAGPAARRGGPGRPARRPGALRRSQRREEGGRRLRPAARGREAPRVTVAVVGRDAGLLLGGTLQSVLRQRGPAAELVVVDRGSRDETVELLRALDGEVDSWCSEPGLGESAALDAAALRATGTYLVVLAPGDVLRGDDVLSTALADAPGVADVVVAHHVRQRASGHEALRVAEDLPGTLARLAAGDVDGAWLARVPAPAATLVRTELVRREGFRADLGPAAHAELLLRLARRGAPSHHALSVLATVLAPTRAAEARFLEELRRVALEYTARPELVVGRFDAIREERWREELPFLGVPELLWSLGRVRARKELARRVRARLGGAAR
jgi:hypothetical protein